MFFIPSALLSSRLLIFPSFPRISHHPYQSIHLTITIHQNRLPNIIPIPLLQTAKHSCNVCFKKGKRNTSGIATKTNAAHHHLVRLFAIPLTVRYSTRPALPGHSSAHRDRVPARPSRAVLEDNRDIFYVGIGRIPGVRNQLVLFLLQSLDEEREGILWSTCDRRT